MAQFPGHAGPPAAPIGQQLVFTTTAKNEGRIEAQWVEIKLPIPEGLEFVSSNPTGPMFGVSRSFFGPFADRLVGTRVRPGTGPPKWWFFDPHHHPS